MTILLRGHLPSSVIVRKLTEVLTIMSRVIELKVAAFKVINSKDFKTKKDQAVALLAALKLTYTMDLVPCKDPRDPLVKVELHCDYNGLFIDFKRNIYNYIIDYLRDMLD
ncbi:uncharacterized protein LOC111071680 isoform X2 [Drosophila obscura]|uniref:uncharacterized protein LOC111071680 isoform X2 n=1 Tax=Drosophila obscura TaxID=7282 RepID=UPI001BB16F06|nr:uncharacterized protein LOC111071680 isoform X2 [Drosophila obscura]